MSAIRAYLGSSCPSCHKDILQAAPSTNRMPGEEKAWCASCNTRFSADQLARPKAGFLKRLFGGRPHSA